jgi:hypothetical protein
MGIRPISIGSIPLAFLACSCSTDSGTSGNAGSVATDPVVAAKAWAAMDSVCVQTINTHRGSISLAPLAHWTDSAPCFSRQADLDFASGTGHANFGLCKESAQNTCPGWNSDTTISARASTMKRCILNMWNEGPGEPYSAHGHYINMTKASYTKVGCGFHHENGLLWINMDFR